jgi:hypothetical protein
MKGGGEDRAGCLKHEHFSAAGKCPFRTSADKSTTLIEVFKDTSVPKMHTLRQYPKSSYNNFLQHLSKFIIIITLAM